MEWVTMALQLKTRIILFHKLNPLKANLTLVQSNFEAIDILINVKPFGGFEELKVNNNPKSPYVEFNRFSRARVFNRECCNLSVYLS